MPPCSKLFYSLMFATLLAIPCVSADSVASKAPADLSEKAATLSWKIINDIVSEIGARPAGSEQEIKAIQRFAEQYWGAYSSQPVSILVDDRESLSQNAWLTIRGNTDQHIIIGAHADSTGENNGSLGATDNGLAMALLLALGNVLKEQPLHYTVTLVLFGAEEVGLWGSTEFVRAMQADRAILNGVPLPAAMLNLDTIAGGDHLYIHSPTQIPYTQCKSTDTYNPSPVFRDALLQISNAAALPFKLHPAYPGYPEGETGGWSDHVAFACAGIATAYIEATNFAIKGRDGYDGYSQALHPALWTCLKPQQSTACNADKEQRWGSIWHTRADQLTVLNELYPGRLQSQLNTVSSLLVKLLTSPPAANTQLH